MPEWLTRKLGPLATWQWALIGVGGLVVFKFLQQRRAAASSAATPAGTSTNYSASVPTYTEPSATVTTPGGFSYSGPLSGIQSIIPTGAMAQTNGSNTSGLVAGTVGTGAGQFQQVPGPLQNQQFAAGNVTQYAQPIPGEFVPVPITLTSTGVPNANAPLTYIMNP